MTLHQRSGNDADQAALLVALLRAAGYPARFVRGTSEFFPDPTGILAQTGVADLPALAGFFQKAGIPCQPVIRGGRIANLQVEHIWVEAEIPYDNYRGAVLDDRGKVWLALDTQIKSAGMTVNAPPALPAGVDLAGLRDQYLATARTDSPLAFLRAAYTAAGADYDGLLHRRTANFEELQILPASLQFEKVAVTGEYTTLPDSLKHRVRLVASHEQTILFDATLALADLSNRSLAITYEPATVEDQEIINSYGGLSNTPAYLVHLRPVLTVDGERTLIGTSGLPVGSDFKLTVELIAPNHTERIENALSIGNLAVLGLVAQQAVLPPEIAAADKNGERLLYERAMSYIDQWNQAEEELAAMLDLPLLRPLPTLVTVGNLAEVTRLLDVPHGLEWRGVYVDADFRAVELGGGDGAKRRLFMQLAGLQGSVLEERVLSEGFGVAAVSTAKLLGLSNSEGLPPLELNQGNLDVELPALGLAANVVDDIKLAVAQGLRVTIPPSLSLHEDWQGVGYLKEDPASGEAGWMLSGQIAGGMTAWNPERWPLDAAAEVLANSYNEQPNRDPGSAMFIQKITATDQQVGTVGQPLPKNLQVYVTDSDHRPVKGAEVVFTVKAGGGTISGQPTMTVKTDFNGVAAVSLTLGQHTADNASLWWEDGTTYSQQVGENIVDAALKSGAAVASPFTALAKPGAPDHLSPTMGGNVQGYVLNWGGPVGLIVADKYGNSIANQSVTFTALAPVNQASCANPGTDLGPAQLAAGTDPCVQNFPTYGGSCGATTLTTITDYRGTHAQVILGPMPGALYRISAKAGQLATSFDWWSWPEVDCQGTDQPTAQILLDLKYQVDQFGNSINAGPVGGKIPVEARCTVLQENGTSSGTGSYYLNNLAVTAVVLSPPEVVMGGQGNGVYGAEYTLPETAAVNQITVTCRAVVDGEPQSVDKTFPVSGVALRFPYLTGSDTSPQAVVVAVNEAGYLTHDQALSYQIQPAGYQAGSAYLLVYRDGEPIFLTPTEKTGIGFATLAQGMWLEPGGNYEAEVVLNPGSGVEIRSAKVPLHVVSLELDADLNGDGIFAEDDPLEYTSPGLLVRLNSDDDDSDGIIDYDDGFDKDNWPSNADDTMLKTNPDGTSSAVEDDELVEIRLTTLPADLNRGTVVLELIQGQEQIRVWSSREKKKDKVLIEPGLVNGANPRKVWVLGQDIDSLGALPPTLYLEGIKAATGPAVLVTKYISPDGAETEADRLLVSVYRCELVPDYNRDGMINSDDQGKVTPDKPWRFWINDDDDGHADPNGIGSSANDLPGQGKDNSDGKVNGIRDLVDFFPIRLDISSLLTLLPPEQGYRYFLKNTEGALGLVEGLITSGIASGTKLTSDAVDEYLKEPATGIAFGGESVQVVSADGVALSESFLQKLKENDQTGIILLEGRKAAKAPIVLEVRDNNGLMVISADLPLEILTVEEMTGHKDLRPVAGGSAGAASRTPLSPPYAMTEGSSKVLVWMHGYNVDSEAARATYAEVFKRFFHAGLMGKFYGVSWYGDPPAAAIGPPHYHQAVVNAFATARDFALFVEGFGGNASIAAHSLGNLVAGSAIQDHGLANFNKYFAIDAAVALEAYGQENVVESMLDVEDWLDYWNFRGTDSQGNPVSGDKLPASEWYRLFEGTADNRKGLTWRNRLGNVPSDRVYNFYSSTEEVLREYPNDDLVKYWELLQNYGDVTGYLSIFTWVKQEKFKGRNLTLNLGGISSPFVGWSFSGNYSKPSFMPPDFSRRYTPEEAAVEISKEALKTEPFFALDTRLLSHDLDNLVAPDSNGTSPGDFVMKKISETGLKSYYTDNVPAHDRVTVRDWLLAEAFPATTLPMGANKNDRIDDDQEVDMSRVRDNVGGCCKTNEVLWPRGSSTASGVRDWWHSDFKDVPYQLTYEFYNRIKSLIGN